MNSVSGQYNNSSLLPDHDGMYLGEDFGPPLERDRFRGPLTKSSGKIPAFKLWLDREGHRIFQSRFGHRYSPRSSSDKALMDPIYKALPPATKERYKKMADGPINAPDKRARRRKEANKWYRDVHHNDPFGALEALKEHKRRVAEEQERNRLLNGPARIPKPDSIYDPNTLYDDDYALKRRQDIIKLSYKFKFLETNPSVDKRVLNLKFQFVGLLDFCNMINNKRLYTYPAELALVTFSLDEGIVSWEHCKLNFDPDFFYPASYDNNQPDVQNKRRRMLNDATELALQWGLQLESEDGLTPGEAWDWFRRHHDKSAVLVCDDNRYNYVMGALKALSYSISLKEASEFQSVELYTIQDIALAMKEAEPNRYRNAYGLSNSTILDFFMRPRVAVDKYCDTHMAMRYDDHRRVSCQLATAAIKIQLFFEVAYKNNMFDFKDRGIFCADKHLYCTEETRGVIELPSHPQLTRFRAPRQPRSDDPTACFVPRPKPNLVDSSDGEEEEDGTDPEAVRQIMNRLRLRDEPPALRQPQSSRPPMSRYPHSAMNQPPARGAPSVDLPGPSRATAEPSSSSRVPVPPVPRLGASQVSANDKEEETVPEIDPSSYFQMKWMPISEERWSEKVELFLAEQKAVADSVTQSRARGRFLGRKFGAQTA